MMSIFVTLWTIYKTQEATNDIGIKISKLKISKKSNKKVEDIQLKLDTEGTADKQLLQDLISKAVQSKIAKLQQ